MRLKGKERRHDEYCYDMLNKIANCGYDKESNSLHKTHLINEYMRKCFWWVEGKTSVIIKNDRDSKEKWSHKIIIWKDLFDLLNANRIILPQNYTLTFNLWNKNTGEKLEYSVNTIRGDVQSQIELFERWEEQNEIYYPIYTNWNVNCKPYEE